MKQEVAPDLSGRMQRLEQHLGDFERGADPVVREKVRHIVQSLLGFHGASLARLRELVLQAGNPGREILEKWARDELVGSLLLLHGLHPWDLQTRLRHALDQLRPRLRVQGAEILLLSATEKVVRLRLLGGTDAVAELRSSVAEAILAAIPEADRVEVEATVEPSSGRFPLPLLVGR